MQSQRLCLSILCGFICPLVLLAASKCDFSPWISQNHKTEGQAKLTVNDFWNRRQMIPGHFYCLTYLISTQADLRKVSYEI